MPVVLTFLDSNGRWRKCGARCYGANNPSDKCKCVCKRRNHGAGFSQAVINTKAAEGEVQIIPDGSHKRNRPGQMELLETLEEFTKAQA
jgi:hypothetical protein